MVNIGGAQEELSLERWMAEVDEEVRREMAAGREVNEEAMSKRVGEILKAKGARGKQLMRNAEVLECASVGSKALSECSDMRAVKANFKSVAPPPQIRVNSHMARSRGSPPDLLMMPAVEDRFEAVESEVSEGQAYRMVQKSKARNKKFFHKE